MIYCGSGTVFFEIYYCCTQGMFVGWELGMLSDSVAEKYGGLIQDSFLKIWLLILIVFEFVFEVSVNF